MTPINMMTADMKFKMALIIGDPHDQRHLPSFGITS